MNNMKKNKLLIIIISLTVLFLAISQFAFVGAKITCGKFKALHISKGIEYITYEFKVNNKIIVGNIPSSSLKIKKLDSLKNIDCIKIEYSKFTTFFNRVADERVTW